MVYLFAIFWTPGLVAEPVRHGDPPQVTVGPARFTRDVGRPLALGPRLPLCLALKVQLVHDDPRLLERHPFGDSAALCNWALCTLHKPTQQENEKDEYGHTEIT